MSLFLSDFKNLVELGRGAQGRVFCAHQISMERSVVLKSQLCPDKKQRSELLKQIRRLSAVTINGVPKIYQVFSRSKKVWTVMEWFEGIPLLSVLPVDWSIQLRLYLAVLISEVLSNIHENNWIHGDLKPSNILLTKDGAVKIVDLGFAMPETEFEVRRNNISGTLLYMAPELKLQKQTDLKKADIFALGVILHELFAGKKPERDIQTQKIIPEPIAHVAEPINSIIFKSLEYLPEARSRSVKQILPNLQNHLTSSTDDLKQQLADTVDPIYRRYISDCFTSAARKEIKNTQKAYHLVCEAMEWNPDNTEAIDLLEKLPPTGDMGLLKKQYKIMGAVFFAGALLAFFILKKTFSPTQTVDTGKIYYAKEHEYLASIPEKRKRVPHLPLLAGKENKETASGKINIRGVPEKAKLFLDNKLLVPEGKVMTLGSKPGEYVLKLIIDSVKVWEKEIKVLPFQKIDINLSDVRYVKRSFK